MASSTRSDWSKASSSGPFSRHAHGESGEIGECPRSRPPGRAARRQFDATRDRRSLDEVDGPRRGRHVQVPDFEFSLREVMHNSADAHVLGARSEVAERVEANDGIRVVLVGGRCRCHAERLLAVVELEDLPAEGHACLGTKLIELVEVPLPHKGDGDPGFAGAAGPADPVREHVGIFG